MTSSHPGRRNAIGDKLREGAGDLGVMGHAREQLAAQWARVRGRLQSEVGDVVYRNWMRDMTLVRLDGDEVTIVLPSPFRRDWVRSNYGDRLAALWRSENPGVRRVELSFAQGAAQAGVHSGVRGEAGEVVGAVEPEVADGVAGRLASSAQSVGAQSLAAQVLVEEEGESGRFDFDTFVVGKPNEFAYACARRVAERPASKGFNPLFLYGGVGLGKTHLMHAIGRELRRSRGGEIRVAYMSAESFMHRFISAIRSNTTLDFKEELRSQDVLMIDDIQFLIGKDSTQEEFFHTFNALVDAGRQIVVSADKSPSALDGIEGRLSTRLGCGMVADLHATTFELRLSILTAKAAHAEIAVPPKVLEFLAHKINTNVRELEGGLNRLVAHASLCGGEITLEGTHDVLRDLLKAHDRRVTIEEIQKRVAAHWGIRLTDMTSARRSRNVARPRQVAMYLAKQCTERSLPEIGRMFGNRDHTTVMHAVERVTQLMGDDPEFRENVELLHELLKR